MRQSRHLRLALAAGALALVAGCSPAASSDSPDSSSAAGAPGAGATTVGVIAVGPKDDFGYNQAVSQGVEALRAEFPDVKMLEAYNIPEDDTAATTMESMVAQGATVLFATSYGHLDAAKAVAAAHPDVAVVHQGGLISPAPANMGTYFGSVFEPVYVAGSRRVRPPRPASWATSTPSRSRRPWPTSTRSPWAPRPCVRTSRSSPYRPRAGATPPPRQTGSSRS